MARDLAIDLGTANTLVYAKGRGIVLNEPSVIALNVQTGEVLAMGHEAWQMIGRTPGYIQAVRPLRKGAITDFDVTQRMIRLLLHRAGAADCHLIEQPVAAAIGAGLPINEPLGNMVVDVGGGTSETAVISLGGVVALRAIRTGSFDVDKIAAASPGVEFKGAPEGYVRIHENHHLWSKTRVGRAKLDGQFELIYETADLVEPDPFPKGYQ